MVYRSDAVEAKADAEEDESGFNVWIIWGGGDGAEAVFIDFRGGGSHVYAEACSTGFVGQLLDA